MAARLPSLTGMRFVAALLVFVTHITVTGFFHPDTGATLFRYAFASGWLGVEFFFVLSGFVLTWSARSGDTVPRFWRRRLAKVYPTHLVSWLAALLLALAAGVTVTTGQTVPSFLLVHAWVPDVEVMRSLNVPSWSLSCELLFYLAFPLLHGLVRRIAPERLWAWALGVAGVIMLLPLAADLLISGSPALPGMDMSLHQNWFLIAFPPVRALDFVLGILMARIVLTGRRLPLRLPGAVLLTLAGFAAQIALVPTLYGLTMTTALPLALLVAAGANADVSGAGSPLRGRTMVRLGEISFALYMFHYLVIDFAHRQLGATRSWDVPAALGLALLLLAAASAVAWLSYTFVEQPVMRRWSRPREAAGSRPGPVAPAAGGGDAPDATGEEQKRVEA
ncbi:acyltransferase [Streptomyces sp. NPDC091267]|uniref:acyltransferase family protein n=1 Tax=Streptomyces sp. NPDC091267 TaxID=3155195 RepID=UPI003427D63F